MLRSIGLAAAFVAAVCFGHSTYGRSMDPGEAAILRKVAPAVVSISVWKARAPDEAGGSMRRVKTYGSGFIIDPSGIIVTNQHVIDSALEVTVVLNDGTRAPGKVIDASPLTDLAVLKIAVGHPLPALSWGNSDALQVGDPVLTVGNGLDLGTSVSSGIVSGLNRNFSDSPFDSYIQTDAVINHGNSGGPLIDSSGKVVGVDEALINPSSSGFIGVGLAIPTSIAKFVTGRLLDPHHLAPGWLGFSLQDLTPPLAAPLRAPRTAGAVISEVVPNGPASQAGLRDGDVVDRIDGQAMDDSRAFQRVIAKHTPGQVVHLTVWRSGQKQEVAVTVAGWPNYKPNGGVMTGAEAAEMMNVMPDIGVKLAALDDAERTQYGISPSESGVLVAHVEADSEASELGITAGDVVENVQGVPVTTPDDVHKAVREAHEKHLAWIAVLLRVKTGPIWIPISIGSAGT
jgi:serine protease Do